MAIARPAAPEELGLLSLGRRSMTYALGGLAYKGLALVSVPLIARVLSPTELGLLDLCAVVATVVGLSVAVGSEHGVAYLEPRTTADDRVWESTLTIIAALAGIALALSLVFSGPLAALLTGDHANAPLIVAAAVYGAVIAVTSVALNAVRLRATPRTYAVASFLVVAAEMSGAVAVALVVESPVTFMVLAWAAGSGLVAVIILARYLPRLRAPRARTVRRLVAYGAPLVPATVAWLLGDVLVRASLAQQGDLAALGEYGIASRIASLVALAVGGFGVAWHPYLYRSDAEAVIPRASRVLAYAILGLGVLAIVLTMLAREVVLVLGGTGYERAAEAVGPLAGGMVAFGAFVLVSAVLGASSSTRLVGAAAFIGASVQVLGAVVAASQFGLVGAAWASLAGYVVGAAILLASRRQLLRGRRGALSLAAMVLFGVALVLADAVTEWPLVARIPFAMAAIVIFFGAAGIARKLERRPTAPRGT